VAIDFYQSDSDSDLWAAVDRETGEFFLFRGPAKEVEKMVEREPKRDRVA
jgi:hypothetical protein